MAENDVNQREYGELIATVRHLSEQVNSLQSALLADTNKLHGRIDQFMESTVTKAEHDRLVRDVSQMWKLQRGMEKRLASADVGINWLRDGLWLVLVIAAAGAGITLG